MKNINREAVTIRFRSEDLRLAKQILKANGRSDNLKAEFKHIILNVLNAALKELKDEAAKLANQSISKGESNEGGNSTGDSAETQHSGASDSNVSSGQAELLDSSKRD